MRQVLIAAVLALGIATGGEAHAAGQGVIATVNDTPITAYDIDQRIKLLQILGDRSPTGQSRKKALTGLIDEVIQISEAKKYKVDASEDMIAKQLARIAKSLGTDEKGLQPKLRAQGISIQALRQYIAAQIGFSRILQGKYQVKVDVNQADVDKKMAEIKREADTRLAQVMKDPRLQAVTVYSIQEIELPLDNVSDANASQLLQSRAIEAIQMMKNYRGCGSARAAASGIFNVKIGKTVDADGRKLPPQLRAALDKAGAGRAIGPGRTKNGIQIIGFCGKRKITPPKPKFALPTRDQVENAAYNEKYAAVEEKYMKDLRKTALIEYRDPSYSQ